MAFIFTMIKKYRIKKNEEFSSIIAKRRSRTGESFVLYLSPRREEYSRIGISVSRKLGNAVVRNRVKRQIRMMIANFYDFNGSDRDIIIIARNRFLNKSFEDNQRELEKLIKSYIIIQYGRGDQNE